MKNYTDEIKTILDGLGERNISGIHLVVESQDIPMLKDYSNDLLFVNLNDGKGIVYRFNTIEKKFDLWQGTKMFQQKGK